MVGLAVDQTSRSLAHHPWADPGSSSAIHLPFHAWAPSGLERDGLDLNSLSHAGAKFLAAGQTFSRGNHLFHRPGRLLAWSLVFLGAARGGLLFRPPSAMGPGAALLLDRRDSPRRPAHRSAGRLLDGGLATSLERHRPARYARHHGPGITLHAWQLVPPFYAGRISGSAAAGQDSSPSLADGTRLLAGLFRLGVGLPDGKILGRLGHARIDGADHP